MWLYYLLLAVGAAQAGKHDPRMTVHKYIYFVFCFLSHHLVLHFTVGKRQRVIKGTFREGMVKIQSAENQTGETQTTETQTA